MLKLKPVFLLFLSLFSFNIYAAGSDDPTCTLERSEFLDLPETQEELNLLILEEMKDLVRSLYETVTTNKEKIKKGELPNIDSGFWYANAYFEILEEGAHLDPSIATRLEEFKSKNYFVKGYAAPESLFIQKEGILNYYLKAGAKPSEALKRIGSDLIFIDCALAFDLAGYRVALKFLGEEAFDKNFVKADNLPFFAAQKTSKIKNLMGNYRISTEKPGPIATNFYIWNHPLYAFKELNGEAQGFNLIVSGENESGEPLFLGLGLHPDGVTAREVRETLISEFNREPFNARIMDINEWNSSGPSGDYLLLLDILKSESIESLEDSAIWKRLASSYGKMKNFDITAEQMEGALVQEKRPKTIAFARLDVKKLANLKKRLNKSN